MGEVLGFNVRENFKIRTEICAFSAIWVSTVGDQYIASSRVSNIRLHGGCAHYMDLQRTHLQAEICNTLNLQASCTEPTLCI